MNILCTIPICVAVAIVNNKPCDAADGVYPQNDANAAPNSNYNTAAIAKIDNTQIKTGTISAAQRNHAGYITSQVS